MMMPSIDYFNADPLYLRTLALQMILIKKHKTIETYPTLFRMVLFGEKNIICMACGFPAQNNSSIWVKVIKE